MWRQGTTSVYDWLSQSISDLRCRFCCNIEPKEKLDAAIFRIRDEGLVTSYQGQAYDTPAATGPLVPGMMVEKVGRTTGHTKGQVISQMYGAFPVNYTAALYGFNGSVLFEPVFCIVGNGSIFSDSGDSGSLITSVDANGNRIAVGLVFAGMPDVNAPGGKLTLALPLEPVLNQLGVTLVSGHNV
jgi:hypothetical protein